MKDLLGPKVSLARLSAKPLLNSRRTFSQTHLCYQCNHNILAAVGVNINGPAVGKGRGDSQGNEVERTASGRFGYGITSHWCVMP